MSLHGENGKENGRMPIRVHNFGGVIGWNAKKYLPWVASESYLKLQFVSRRRSQKGYIDFFLSHKEAPHPQIGRASCRERV